MFETFSDKAVTNLIYCYRLAVPYKIMKVICESSYIKKCTRQEMASENTNQDDYVCLHES